jgi:hypothetical protein
VRGLSFFPPAQLLDADQHDRAHGHHRPERRFRHEVNLDAHGEVAGLALIASGLVVGTEKVAVEEGIPVVATGVAYAACARGVRGKGTTVAAANWRDIEKVGARRQTYIYVQDADCVFRITEVAGIMEKNLVVASGGRTTGNQCTTVAGRYPLADRPLNASVASHTIVVIGIDTAYVPYLTRWNDKIIKNVGVLANAERAVPLVGESIDVIKVAVVPTALGQHSVGAGRADGARHGGGGR